MLNLPKELHLLIISLLDTSSQFSLRHVCRFYKQILSESSPRIFNYTIVKNAITNDYYDLFKHFLKNYPDLRIYFEHNINDLCALAAEIGSFELLKYIYKKLNNKYKYKYGGPSADVIIASVEGGQIDIVKWLHENGCPWNSYACNVAASINRLDILQYLHDNGCTWTVWTITCAAEKGHLEVLRYLRQNGCDWDKFTCAFAASKNQLEVLKYLHENGCPWSSLSCMYANTNSYTEILKYLHDNGCPCAIDICNYCNDNIQTE